MGERRDERAKREDRRKGETKCISRGERYERKEKEESREILGERV